MLVAVGLAVFAAAAEPAAPLFEGAVVERVVFVVAVGLAAPFSVEPVVVAVVREAQLFEQVVAESVAQPFELAVAFVVALAFEVVAVAPFSAALPVGPVAESFVVVERFSLVELAECGLGFAFGLLFGFVSALVLALFEHPP